MTPVSPGQVQAELAKAAKDAQVNRLVPKPFPVAIPRPPVR